MSSTDLILAAAGAGGDEPVYVDDVYSTFLYTGNGSTQTITNGIDLAGEGGMVWIKNRSLTDSHIISDTIRGASYHVRSNATSAQTLDTTNITSFNSSGFSVGTNGSVNNNTNLFASWTFRKAPKFFDVVTYTGNAVANRQISHSLGSTPGMVIVKCISDTDIWMVYHRSSGAQGNFLILNSTAAVDTRFANFWGTTPFSSTTFSVSDFNEINGSGRTYVAYLFAHDAGGFGESGTDNVISCGSIVLDGDGNGTVDLGYEPQFVLAKVSSTSGDWFLFDTMRGIVTPGADPLLRANLSNAESSIEVIDLTSTGFKINTLGINATMIYMAIRRPMKVPTTGTEVFSPTVYTGTNVDNRLINTGILTDMVMIKERNDTVAGMRVGDRLRGNPYLTTGTTTSEVNDADSLMTPTSGFGNAFSAMNGVGVGNDATSKVNIDTTSNNHIALAFKRATGFMDVVCFSGTGSARTVVHNLGVAPELIIIKHRTTTQSWTVYNKTVTATDYLQLNTDNSSASLSTMFNNTEPTSSVFTVGTNAATNAANNRYVAYLFATLAGISKVGSFVHDGVNPVTVNCGFSTGARFVMFKSVSTSGDWWVVDTARGIVSGADPALKLNSSAAEITNGDFIDPVSSGFIATENLAPATYIYLAIA